MTSGDPGGDGWGRGGAAGGDDGGGAHGQLVLLATQEGRSRGAGWSAKTTAARGERVARYK